MPINIVHVSDDEIHKASQASEDSAHHDLDSDAAQQIEKHYKQIMKKKRGKYMSNLTILDEGCFNASYRSNENYLIG